MFGNLFVIKYGNSFAVKIKGGNFAININV